MLVDIGTLKGTYFTSNTKGAITGSIDLSLPCYHYLLACIYAILTATIRRSINLIPHGIIYLKYLKPAQLIDKPYVGRYRGCQIRKEIIIEYV